MGNFLRDAYGLDNEQGFMQGAGRLLLSIPAYHTYPDGIEDLLDLSSGGTAYDPASGWIDAGFTKTGINITRNKAEEEFTVDQVRAAIRRRPTSYEMSVGTQLAEATLETFQLAWDLGDITTVVKAGAQLDERHVGLSAPTTYVSRMLAVVFQFEDGIIRAYVLRNVNTAAQETGFTLQSTGEQVSLPVRFNAQADSTQPVSRQFGDVFEQIPA